MLDDVLDILGDRDIALAKEMTKVFEDVRRGPISAILATLNDETVRGEYTVVVAGHKDRG
jgi:16S rRNA (cytidine1402-2'-O)-methyltransferase